MAANKKNSRSTRGTSRSERMQEYFQAQLNNIQPEHQPLFRRMWMRMQGEAKKTGKAPYERFYDWLNEHPEAVLELEEKLAQTDDQIAKAERSARKRAGKSLEAPKVSPAKAASEVRSLTRWQLREMRNQEREQERALRSECSVSSAATGKQLRSANESLRNLRFETDCDEEYSRLTPAAARSACSRGRQKFRLVTRIKALQSKLAHETRKHECKTSPITREIARLEREAKLLDSVIEADNKVVRKRPSKALKGEIPF